MIDMIREKVWQEFAVSGGHERRVMCAVCRYRVPKRDFVVLHGKPHCKRCARVRDYAQRAQKQRVNRGRGRGAPKFCMCAHRVLDHFDLQEDEFRKCSMPDCDCKGLSIGVRVEKAA